MHGTLPKRQSRPSGTAPLRDRRRRSAARARQAVSIAHVVLPGVEIARAEARERETLSAFLRRSGWARRDKKLGWQFRNGLPTIVEVNGAAMLRAAWRTTRIGASDVVRFISKPLGGGQGNASGKQVIGLVALIAVSAFAVAISGGLLAPVLGPAFAAGSIGATVAAAGIGIGGSLLINALTQPKAGATNTPTATVDQIYSVAAAGNTAKLGQPLPIAYGREKVLPDFAATPWSEFVGNDQYLNVLLSVGMGTFAFEQILVDDTVLWDSSTGVQSAFSSAQVAFYDPGATVTLFPVNVAQSLEVTGQELPDPAGVGGGWIGGFIANPSGTLAQSIAVDFLFPAGCFTLNPSSGNLGASSVQLIAEIRTVDDAGAPTSSFVTLFNVTRTYASRSPIRDSVKVDVAAARYEVRFRRGDAPASGTSGANNVIWAGLRSFLQGANAFADVSTIAIRILATQSTQGSYKFGVIRTRKVPVWNGSIFVTEASRNAGWAFLDAVSNTDYGAGYSQAKVDFQTILNFAQGCTDRGDCFDYTFASAVSVPEAFDKILGSARAKHFWLGDTISVVRDEQKTAPAMLLTDREIVRGSTQISWTMLGDQDPDAVVIEYIDEETWRPAQVQYPPDSFEFTASNPAVQRLDGVVQRAQAFREAAFYYLQSIYRRENVQVDVEYEGRAITFGAVLRVQSELPMAYGYGGAVVDRATNTLTLDPAPSWSGPSHFIRLRRPDGKWFGPVVVTRGVDDAHAVLDGTDLASVQTAQAATLADVLARADGGEYPSFDFGTSDNQSRLCVVLGGAPNGNTCTLSLVVDDGRVHASDLGDPPILPTAQFPADQSAPVIALLTADWGNVIAEPTVNASWWPAGGALYYVADVSYDSGANWIRVYEGRDNKFSAKVDRAALRLRVAGVGVRFGAYSYVDLAAPTIEIAADAVSLASLKADLKAQVTVVENALNDRLNEALNTIAAIVANQDSRNWTDKQRVRTQLSSINGTLTASFEQVATVATDTQTAFASFQTTVSASIGSISASVTTVSSAVATLDGYVAASWAVKIDANKYVAGLELVNAGDSTSAFTVLVDKFQVAFPGHSGGDPVPVFTIANVNGSPKVALRGDMLVDGTITAAMIQAGAITAAKIQAGSIGTNELAVNGVDINKLVVGAATHISTAQLSSAVHFGDNAEHTLLSLSVTTLGGILQVIANAGGHDDVSSMTQLGATFRASPVTSSTYKLYVDGVQFDFQTDERPLITTVLSLPSTIQYPTVARTNALMMAAVSLAAGTHTIAVTAQMVQGVAVSGGANGITFDRGAIIAFESRR